VCEDISHSPGVREIGGRDGLLKGKKQKKQKKREGKKQQTSRRKNTPRETTYF
jgi:hypothetical protein